jgi:hypothetical protein
MAARVSELAALRACGAELLACFEELAALAKTPKNIFNWEASGTVRVWLLSLLAAKLPTGL